MNRLVSLESGMRSLVIFRDLLSDEAVRSFLTMLACQDEDAFIDACADFEAALFSHCDNWSDYLVKAILSSENIAVRMKAVKESSSVIDASLKRELAILSDAAAVRLEDFPFGSVSLFTPWNTSETNLSAAYDARLDEAAVRGYGMYAEYHVFSLTDEGLVPVKYPDPQKLSELPGYEAERRKVIANVEALLKGDPAV
ncbi:MAG: hypothetical protein J6S26_05595, partial [Solobacterium sp.]|nr:hypothetical protein [Solobacterium sp.]